MGRINNTRVLIGGLAAGLVIDAGELFGNLVLFAQQGQEWFERFELAQPGGGTIVLFNVLGLALGITTVWLYAAIRPRFGAGAKTAACAGATAWALFSLLPMTANYLVGLADASYVIPAGIWALVEITVAAVVGGSLYRED